MLDDESISPQNDPKSIKIWIKVLKSSINLLSVRLNHYEAIFDIFLAILVGKTIFLFIAFA